MTEVPEHLLARSRARRSAVGGGGADAAPAASTPATTESDSPAGGAATPATTAPAAAAPVVPAAPEPVTPWVEAAQRRQKIPGWAVPVLAMLPLWAVIYALTLDVPTPTEAGPLEAGAAVYVDKGCSGCHGATGGGSGAVPALTGDNATPTVFPSPAEQVRWVALGTTGYEDAGLETYGDGKAVRGSGAVMPGWMDSLTADELMDVVLHERSGLNDETFDPALWEEGFEETLAEVLPADKVAEYVAVLEAWKADPPAP